ncbi:MAG: quinol:cytochrome C oxidoreductase [Ignavibacteria bacterium]|nr:quinol:cytochrome C oxidoreductase [Ignavibacteria bacterium]
MIGAGAALAVAAWYVDGPRAAFNNVVMFMMLASIGIGSLFLISLEYVAGAVWSTPMRRVSEILAFIIPVTGVAALPMFLNLHDLFHWTHAEAVEADAILKGKSPYLNVTFFGIRFVATFAIWYLFYHFITRNSRKQDSTGDQLFTRRNIRLSAIFIPVFAVTVTFLAIDWIMSLEPHWFSTIFGVYYFSGTMLAALAAATIAIILLHENGYFGTLLRRDHFYSLGALMFAFVNFWAYIAFSQYLLIWYANLPEETFWMTRRWEGGWEFLSLALIVVHFVVPYVGLLAQEAKMNPRRLKIMAIWILFAHFIDLYWLVMPTHHESFFFGWMEVGFPLLSVGIVLLVFILRYRKTSLIPTGDPKLKRGLDFRL